MWQKGQTQDSIYHVVSWLVGRFVKSRPVWEWCGCHVAEGTDARFCVSLGKFVGWSVCPSPIWFFSCVSGRAFHLRATPQEGMPHFDWHLHFLCRDASASTRTGRTRHSPSMATYGSQVMWYNPLMQGPRRTLKRWDEKRELLPGVVKAVFALGLLWTDGFYREDSTNDSG